MIGEEEKRAVLEVLDRRSPFRYYGNDPAFKATELEKAFAETMGVRHALAVSSGTAALIVAMRALGVGPGDEVILPAATFVGCAGAIASCYAVPVFADIDEDVNIDPQAIERVITPRTKAILVVHWRGMVTTDDQTLHARAVARGARAAQGAAGPAGPRVEKRLTTDTADAVVT